MDFILEHVDMVLAWIGGIVSCASIIVKLTPTPKDDTVLEKVILILEKFSVFNSKRK